LSSGFAGALFLMARINAMTIKITMKMSLASPINLQPQQDLR
jgi:hypothetical protein